MNPDLFQNPLRRWGKLKDGKRRPTVLVKELRERDRRRMLRHFLDLEDSDRLLRFGSVLPDEQVTHYVNRIAFSRDMVFGVYNRVFRLVAVGHLAFAPRDESKSAVTVKERVAEFGVSVSRSARGLGIGSKLFERAAIHCRNNDVDTLYMHCLSSNKTMMHIAKKQAWKSTAITAKRTPTSNCRPPIRPACCKKRWTNNSLYWTTPSKPTGAPPSNGWDA
jgi:GNAT superfamily N-acetyltransferase